MDSYLSGMDHLQLLESEVDFITASCYDKRKYELLKHKALMILLEKPDSSDFLNNLKGYNLYGDYNRFIEKLETDVFFERSNACWLMVAFDAFKGNRAMMENCLTIILYETLQGAQQSLVCASITEHDDPGAVLDYLIETQNLVLNITANVENFLNDVEKYIFPKFISSRIRTALLTTAIEPANMNATAKNIGDEITAIDDSKKFHYHVLLTDLTIDDYGSKFQCKDSYKCIDMTVNNIRLMAVRFDVGINMTDHVVDGTTLLLGNLPAWKKWIKHKAIHEKVDTFSNKFFPLTINAFTTIILHNEQQFSSATIINFGTNNITYQGVRTAYALDYFIDYQWPKHDHIIKIVFLIH